MAVTPPRLGWRVRIRLMWGKARRLGLGLFRLGYVRRSAARREGHCVRCGACCRLGYRCQFLREKGGQRTFPIVIGTNEAMAIHRRLNDEKTPRPMTHDLMKQILDTFHVSLDRVVINDLKGNTFYANLHLNVEGKELVVDSRPSDAIALAVRVKAPIFVSESVVKSTEQLGILSAHLLDEEDELTDIMDKMNPEDFGKFKM